LAVTVLTVAAIWGMLTNVMPFLIVGGAARQITGGLLLASLWAFTSLGLWWGRPQGWWCAAFLYQERILQYGSFFSLDLTSAPGRRNIVYDFTILVAVVLQCLVLYTIKPRTWTGVSGWPLKWLVLLPLLALLSLYAVMSVVGALLS